MNVGVLLSGGMDSVTAFYAAHAEHEVVAALPFDYGSDKGGKRHCGTSVERHEAFSLADFADPTNCLQTPALPSQLRQP